jgi:hypothetical protein
LQIFFFDQKGWSGFFGMGFGTLKCLTQEEYREEVYRDTAELREHVSITPVIVVLLTKEGKVESIHHAPPLFTYPRKHVLLNFADSILDPENQLPAAELHSRLTFARAATATDFTAKSPKGIPAPSDFPRYVSASPSGNVNSEIMYNYLVGEIVPFVRSLGVTVEEAVLGICDMLGAHEYEKTNVQLAQANHHLHFGVCHGSSYWQLQDGKPFSILNTESAKDSDSWNQFFKSKGRVPTLQDFPFVIQNAYLKSIKQEVIEAALKERGYFPFNPDAQLEKLAHAETYETYKARFQLELSAATPQTGSMGVEESKAETSLHVGDAVSLVGYNNLDNTHWNGMEGTIISLDEDGRCVVAVSPTLHKRVTLKHVKRLLPLVSPQASPLAPWAQIASEPLSNRSPLLRSTGSVRQRQHPNSVTFDAAFELNDFEGQDRLRKIKALIADSAIEKDAAVRKKPRGKKFGGIGEVFLASAVAAQKLKVKEAKKLTAMKKKSNEEKAKSKKKKDAARMKTLVAENKELKAQGKGSKPQAKKRKSQKIQPMVSSSDEDKAPEGEAPKGKAPNRKAPKRKKVEESSEESSEENSEEGTEESSEENSEEDSEESSAEGSEVDSEANEQEEGSEKSSEEDSEEFPPALAPEGWQIVSAVPSSSECNLEQLGGRQILYRWDNPKGWFRGEVLPEKHEKSRFSKRDLKLGLNANVFYTVEGTRGQFSGEVYPSLLSPEKYGSDSGVWVLLAEIEH